MPGKKITKKDQSATLVYRHTVGTHRGQTEKISITPAFRAFIMRALEDYVCLQKTLDTTKTVEPPVIFGSAFTTYR